MTTDNHDQALEARARELLAAERHADGYHEDAQWIINTGAGLKGQAQCAIRAIVAALREARVPEVSQTTQALINMLVQRDQAGRAKYGVSLDREDLTHQQWLQHMAEEMLDGAGYALAAIRAAAKDGHP